MPDRCSDCAALRREGGWARQPCPGYVHDLDLIEERIANAGFQLRHHDRQHLWHIAVYERSAE